MDTYRSVDSGHTIIFASTRDGMSGRPLPLPVTNFDAKTWLESAAKSANHGCGQVYELFEERLFSSIGGMLNGLPPDQRELLLAEAVAMFGYRDPAVIAAEAAVIREEEAALGIRTCVHHLDPDCCPLGCGDRDEHVEYHKNPNANLTAGYPLNFFSSGVEVSDEINVPDLVDALHIAGIVIHALNARVTHVGRRVNEVNAAITGMVGSRWKVGQTNGEMRLV